MIVSYGRCDNAGGDDPLQLKAGFLMRQKAGEHQHGFAGKGQARILA